MMLLFAVCHYQFQSNSPRSCCFFFFCDLFGSVATGWIASDFSRYTNNAPAKQQLLWCILHQMIEPTRDLVLKKLGDCFPNPAAAKETLALLDTYAELPTFPGDRAKQQARVQLAILKQCRGEIARVKELVKLAKTDFRDALVDAEFPEEIQALHNTPPNEMAAIRRRDRKQYEDWLQSDKS
jgi:hypothetical protein